MRWFFVSLILLGVLCLGISWGRFLATIDIENEISKAVQEKAPFYIGNSKYKLYPINSEKYCIGVMPNGHKRRTNNNSGQPEYRVGDTKITENKASAYYVSFEPNAFYAQRDRAGRVGQDSNAGRDTIRSESGGRFEKATYSEKEIR